jgi:hypothetical protein
MIFGRAIVVTAALTALAACVNRLPDQDRRILAASSIAKMPVEDLSKDYQKDPRAAERRYWGRAVDVSGRVVETKTSPTGSVLAFHDASGAEIVDAALLDDQAAATIASLGEDRRITLRCFCDRYAGHVVLKSCIRP